ncbi:hypothetical protein [Nocardia sp. NPDC056000]|uniref:hypothetical protein n=1 Tax=Nocardia sp. NPDC056000 TaxID=3345674 RepID=UPI0035DE926F
MPDEVKALVVALNLLMNRARLTASVVARQHGLKLTPPQFHDRMSRKSGPPHEVYRGIVESAASALSIDPIELHKELEPLCRAVYPTGPELWSPILGSDQAILGSLDAGGAEVRGRTKWLRDLLQNAREDEAIAALDEHFPGNDGVLAAALIDIAAVDRFGVGLFLDTLACTDSHRAANVVRAISERDEQSAAAIGEVSNLSMSAHEAVETVEPTSGPDQDPDLVAGKRIVALLEQRRETRRLVRELKIRVEADEEIAGGTRRSWHRPNKDDFDQAAQYERPRCSRSFQRLIFGIAMSETVRGPHRLAELLLALHDAGEHQCVNHCVTALFDLGNKYGKPVLRSIARVFENMTTDSVLQILCWICTEVRLQDDDTGAATHDDLEMLLWALDDLDLVLVSQQVAALPAEAALSIGRFVACLPNISSFWRRMIDSQDGYLAGVLLERALADWLPVDLATPQPEEYPPLRWIASALVDVDAMHRMPRHNPRAVPMHSPVITLLKRMLADHPAAAILLLHAVVVDTHPRKGAFFRALTDDADAYEALTYTIAPGQPKTAAVRLFEHLATNLPATAHQLADRIATEFTDNTHHVLMDHIDDAPLFSEILLDKLADLHPEGHWDLKRAQVRKESAAGRLNRFAMFHSVTV